MTCGCGKHYEVLRGPLPLGPSQGLLPRRASPVPRCSGGGWWFGVPCCAAVRCRSAPLPCFLSGKIRGIGDKGSRNSPPRHRDGPRFESRGAHIPLTAPTTGTPPRTLPPGRPPPPASGPSVRHRLGTGSQRGAPGRDLAGEVERSPAPYRILFVSRPQFQRPKGATKSARHETAQMRRI
jgi:hypothetical protein